MIFLADHTYNRQIIMLMQTEQNFITSLDADRHKRDLSKAIKLLEEMVTTKEEIRMNEGFLISPGPNDMLFRTKEEVWFEIARLKGKYSQLKEEYNGILFNLLAKS